MPDFYAREIIRDSKCPNNWKSFLFPGYQKQYGVCKSIRDYAYRVDWQGHYLKEECNKEFFIKYYGTPESLDLFDALYTNKFHLQDKYLRFYDNLAFHFANNSNIFGFDPINEPFPSNFMKDIAIIKPKFFDKNKLLPLYDKVFNVIFKHDKKSILQYETAQFPDIIAAMGGIVRPSGIDRAPKPDNLPRNQKTSSVFNEHMYCCQMDLDECMKPGDDKR